MVTFLFFLPVSLSHTIHVTHDSHTVWDAQELFLHFPFICHSDVNGASNTVYALWLIARDMELNKSGNSQSYTEINKWAGL